MITVTKSAVKQQVIQRFFFLKFRFRLQTVPCAGWLGFKLLTIELAALHCSLGRWLLGQMKKQKAVCTARQCANLWFLHAEHCGPPDSSSSTHSAWSMCMGPSGAHPLSLISRTTSITFSWELQHRLGKTLSSYYGLEGQGDGAVSRRNGTVSPQCFRMR